MFTRFGYSYYLVVVERVWCDYIHRINVRIVFDGIKILIVIAVLFSNVVFIAVSLDPKLQLEPFLKDNPFNYHVIPEGRAIAEKNKVEQYPTHVILDQEGKIAFNSVSYNAVTGYWMRKPIEELRKNKQ